MRSPTIWKAKREIARLGRQVRGVHGYLVSYVAATPYYDMVLSQKIRCSTGQVPLSRRLAVYLIFPDQGVLRSHIAALEYLCTSGFAPLVVANLPITEGDREIILKYSYQLLERPNFGYDFGGYRDAILATGRAQIQNLDRLVLLNDSTWFPIPGGMDWLREAEALGVDYACAAWHGAVTPRDPESFELIEWRIRKGRRNFHYASFAISISSSILRNQSFWGFWKKLRLTNEKHRTVRRGEIGLTRWVLRNGFSHGATTELTRFDHELATMDATDVDNIFSHLVLIGEMKTRQRWLAVLGPDAPKLTRKQKEKAILSLTSREGMSYALADYLVRARGFSFLKKSPFRESTSSAEFLLDTIKTMEGPLGEAILAEANELIKFKQY